MAWQFIAETTGGVSGIVLGTGENIAVGPGATLWATGGPAISSGPTTGSAGHKVKVLGHLFGSTAGLKLTGNPLAQNDILVGPDASIVIGDTAWLPAVHCQGTASRLTNHGYIGGGGYGVMIASGGPTGRTVIVNSGVIEGSAGGIVTPSSGNTENFVIRNRGLISGDIWGIVLSPSNGIHVVRNDGRIEGDVTFGSGFDLYDGRDGTVTGKVFGEGGNDTMMPGLGAETLEGGDGTDLLDFRGRAGVAVSLANDIGGVGAAAGDLYVGFENVSGTRAADTIIGDDGGNLLRGEAGWDAIYGGAGRDSFVGGVGRDTLYGGTGNDTFQWNASTEGGDTIADFSDAPGNDDRFFFAAAGFAGLAAGPLPADAYVVRADNAAQDADDRFVFRTTDRTLWFDGDGNGAGAAILIATLGGAVVPTFADFTVF